VLLQIENLAKKGYLSCFSFFVLLLWYHKTSENPLIEF